MNNKIIVIMDEVLYDVNQEKYFVFCNEKDMEEFFYSKGFSSVGFDFTTYHRITLKNSFIYSGDIFWAKEY